MNNIQLFRQFLSNKFKDGGKKYRDSSYNESTLPQADYIEQYLNTPVGTHLIDNPMYTDEDIASNNTPIIDSNTPVSEVVEDKVTVLPEVIVQGVSPKRKAVARALLDYSMNNQPEIANILVNSNTPTITDKLAVLSKEDIDKKAASIEDELLRQNIESNLTNSHFNHFFADDDDIQKKQIQDLRFLRTMNNTTAYGGDISDNMFETGGPFSWGMPAMPGLIIAQKLKKLFSREPEKKPRNAQTDRKRPNTSSTDKRSENIENQIYGFLPKDRSPYDVPFIPEKSILINGYTTSTNALDSLAKYAGIHNRTLQISEKPLQSKSKTRPVTKEEALGLSLRETKGGALPYSNDSRTSRDKEAKRAFYNANVFTAFQDIPATALVNDYHYNKTSQSVPPLLDAFQYYAQGDYNRGDSNHTTDVREAGNTAFQNPKVVDWWNNEGKYWFNGTYQNAGDETKKKAFGGNLFYDGGYEDNEDIKAIIASQWPATSKVDYALKLQEGFSQFINENGNPRGTIETITPNQVATRWSPVYAKMGIPISERPLLEEANRVDYRDYDKEGNPIGEILMGKNYVTTNQPGQNTIVYNPQYTKIEDIKQDLLHVMHDDPEYEKLYDIYMTEALNDMDFLYHDFSEGDQRAVEAMMNGTFSKSTNDNLKRGLDADATLQSQLDGYLREQFYPGTPEERMAAGYTGVPYAIKNPSLLKAINNIKGYLEQKALGGILTHPTTEKDKYAHGGFKGNLYDGEGDSVNLMNVAADIGTDMIPIVGTIKDAYKFYQEPSLANAGWLALSATTDLLPFLKPIKALKATKAATKAAQAAEKAQIAIIRNEAKKAAEKLAKLRNTPNINPRKVRRAQDQYATYLNMIPERVPQGWAIDRAAEEAAFNYAMKYQMPKVGGELIINTNQEMSDILQKALGGPLFNSRSPIESFQGGRQLPLVRY